MDQRRLQRIIAQAADEGVTELDLSYKGIGSLPAEIGQLSNLQALWLHGNELTFLPSELRKLRQLRWLTLSHNALTSFPLELTELVDLIDLELHRNRLLSIPRQLGRLVNLERLTLSGNRLRMLPDTVGELTNLKTLLLSDNQLSELPETFGRLSSLRWLDVSNNYLKAVPNALLQLRELTTLVSHGNPLESPPPEVAEKGVDAIRNYFRQVQKEGKDRLYEAKLLIVGEAGAGKTSLAKKIQDHNYQLQDTEKSTNGIEVVEWHFSMEGGQDFRVNIWDFGGQEIYHATHQFFLTKRSLYSLVADTRKEDTDFQYWLNVVGLLGGGSPLLIIENERQDRHREINEVAIRGRFRNVKGILPVNLATNRGLAELEKAIRYYISDLPHVGTELPRTWIKVREALEKDERNYIGVAEYLDICAQNGFDNKADKLQLSGYLHDLGVCLHFQEDDLLYKTVILKPEWATIAVYKLLDDKQIIGNRGRFSRADLDRVWCEDCYASMHSELLRLMVNFRLCYRIGQSGEYIVPELLSRNQPKYEWNAANNLTVRYEYEFMPKGIVTQLIVSMNAWICRQDWVWREGVILEREETRAEVIEDYAKREIRIRAVGRNPRNLVTIVLYEIDKINKSFNELKYTKWIPCDCDACRGIEHPHFYALDVLQDFAANGQREIQCQRKPYRMVNVSRLIEGMKPPDPSREPQNGSAKRFRVALSYPGERRPFVEEVAHALTEVFGNERVFYDKYFEAELARPDLDIYLQSIYHDQCDLIVVFLCAEYDKKEWCGLEWRAIRDLIKKRRVVDIMPVRFDDTHVAGLFSIDGYVSAVGQSASHIANCVIERCRLNEQQQVS